MGVLWPLEPATAAKHRLYQGYFDAWWPILLQPARSNGWSNPRVTFLDAFAGPGRYEGGEEGSPLFTLRQLLNHPLAHRMGLSPERVRLVFVEKRRDRYEHLVGELEEHFGPLDRLPVRVEVVHGEAGRDSERVLTDLKAWGCPILAVFDSWGSVNVPYTLVRRIAHNYGGEVITTFGPNWFSRRDALNPDILDQVFGGRQHWTPAAQEQRSDEKWRVWLETYRSALERAGFGFRLHFEVVPRTGQPLYLVYGTRHPKGVEVMKEAMWGVDGSDGMQFRDPRTRGAVPLGQATLWAGGEVPDPELLALVQQRLVRGPATVKSLGSWLLQETSRWRAQDALKAARYLYTEGALLMQPAGRLAQSSVVKLG
jgi:three-Cys-motif partner protein